MVSMTSILAMVAAVAMSVDHVQAHGYIAKPAPTWKKGTNSEWVVQIPPVWEGDWDGARSGEELFALFQKLAVTNNFKDVRSLMDGNPVYGDECGHTDPKGTPRDPPTDGTATFSRGMIHSGPCEIWLDKKMVLQNDNCMEAYGDGSVEKASVFKPIDYSSCAPGGCMLRFYWLALQRLGKKTVWQAYKNCIPLTGPAGGGSSQNSRSSTPSDEGSNKTPSKANSNKTPSKEFSFQTPSDGNSDKTPSPSHDNNSPEPSKEDNHRTPNSEQKSDEKNSKKQDSEQKSDNKDSQKQDSEQKAKGEDSQKSDSGKNSGGENSHTPRSKGDDSKRLLSDAFSSRRRLFSADSKIRPGGDSPMMMPASSNKHNGRRRRRY